MKLRLAWAFRGKNTSSARTLPWRVEDSGAPHPRKGDGPNPVFQRLQEKLVAMQGLDFGTMTAREFFLYQSQPMRGGARYTKIARFGLE